MRISEEKDFICPYCGASNSLSIDNSAGGRQKFVNDCETCCRPILLQVEIDSAESIYVSAHREND